MHTHTHAHTCTSTHTRMRVHACACTHTPPTPPTPPPPNNMYNHKREELHGHSFCSKGISHPIIHAQVCCEIHRVSLIFMTSLCHALSSGGSNPVYVRIATCSLGNQEMRNTRILLFLCATAATLGYGRFIIEWHSGDVTPDMHSCLFLCEQPLQSLLWLHLSIRTTTGWTRFALLTEPACLTATCVCRVVSMAIPHAYYPL